MTWCVLSTGKSGKREVALSLLLLWAFATGYVLFWLPAEAVKDYSEVWDTLTWATFAWSAAAFGLDFVMKSRGLTPTAAPRSQRRRKSDDNAETVIGAA